MFLTLQRILCTFMGHYWYRYVDRNGGISRTCMYCDKQQHFIGNEEWVNDKDCF